MNLGTDFFFQNGTKRFSCLQRHSTLQRFKDNNHTHKKHTIGEHTLFGHPHASRPIHPACTNQPTSANQIGRYYLITAAISHFSRSSTSTHPEVSASFGDHKDKKAQAASHHITPSASSGSC